MADRTYQVEVDGVGTFTFRRRTMADAARIPNEAVKILGGTPEHPYLLELATKQAELAVLTVAAPEGWNLEEMDPLDPDDMDQFTAVHGRFLQAEETFRQAAKAARK